MASNDTWDSFIAKLDSSPLGKRNMGFCLMMNDLGRPKKPALRIVNTNPATYAAKGKPL